MKPLIPRQYTIKLVVRQRRAAGLHDYTTTITASTAGEALDITLTELFKSGWIIPPRAPKPRVVVTPQRWQVRTSVRRATGSGQTIPIKLHLWATSRRAAAEQCRAHMQRGGFITNKIIVRPPDVRLELGIAKAKQTHAKLAADAANFTPHAAPHNPLVDMLDALDEPTRTT